MDLLHILRADLVVSNEKQARFAKWGQLVMPEVKLAMALRFLAGGSPLDLKLIYHVSRSFVYDSIWLVVAPHPSDVDPETFSFEAHAHFQPGFVWDLWLGTLRGVHSQGYNQKF